MNTSQWDMALQSHGTKVKTEFQSFDKLAEFVCLYQSQPHELTDEFKRLHVIIKHK